MRIRRLTLITAWVFSIGCGYADANKVGCSSTVEISDNLNLVKIETNSRTRLEEASGISDCLMQRANSGTIDDVDSSTIDELIDLLNDREDGVRGQAALALGWLGPRAKSAIPALKRAYVRIEKEMSTMKVIPAAASDEEIIVALERITEKPFEQLGLPPIPDDSK